MAETLSTDLAPVDRRITTLRGAACAQYVRPAAAASCTAAVGRARTRLASLGMIGDALA